ncbi:GNAT family N-acetyltransferase [Rhizobium sp. AN95]|uniref:GNAT family N-acetyltransferase n=1 Tax=Rhizobium sp. AN95 TaxID=3035216 RepID=UPI002B25DF79|nr:GNAT family N-acetyltransferase [Rhizobium sp. AN95]
MTLEIRPFSSTENELWDAVVSRSINGTLLHSRKFLSYHGGRFEDMSVFVIFKTEPVGVFPAARSVADTETVVSHPGLTYGGIVHDGTISGDRMLEVMDKLSIYFREKKFRRLIYKAIPNIYAIAPAQDDSYALWRLGAARIRCDLAVAIDLAHRLKPSHRRIRSLKKARAAVNIKRDIRTFDQFWPILSANLARKHEAVPVHSLEEISLLSRRFSTEIELYGAFANDILVAGVLLFKTARVWHAQYIASSEHGYELAALDAVFDEIIRDAQNAGVRYFDFGTCNENGGHVLNGGLYRFKAEFGGAGVTYEQYQLELEER